MKSIALLVTIVPLLLSTSCVQATNKDFEKAGSSIDAFMESFATEMLQHRNLFQEVFENPNRYPEYKYDQTRYALTDGKLLSHPPKEGNASIFATGSKAVGPEEWERIRVLENLEGDLKAMKDSNPDFIRQSFIALLDGVCAIYPPFIVESFIPAGFDIFSFDPEAIKTLEIKNNQSRAPIYGPPYIDLTGNGYIFTLRLPIDRQGTWIGHVGVDLNIDYLKRKFVDIPDRKYLLITEKGVLIALSAESTQFLGIEELENFRYLKQVPTANIPAEVDLLNFKDAEIRELANKAMDNRSFTMLLRGRERKILVRPITATKWIFLEVR